EEQAVRRKRRRGRRRRSFMELVVGSESNTFRVGSALDLAKIVFTGQHLYYYAIIQRVSTKMLCGQLLFHSCFSSA
ncbi:MAG: hypothetical protein U0L77_10360, partial [Prevotellamassilia sp.]|nr:hypothetical protein [Prevotellamassilia sp.]